MAPIFDPSGKPGRLFRLSGNIDRSLHLDSAAFKVPAGSRQP